MRSVRRMEVCVCLCMCLCVCVRAVSPSPLGSAALCRCVAGWTVPPSAAGSPPAPHHSMFPASAHSSSCTGLTATHACRGRCAYSVSSAKKAK